MARRPPDIADYAVIGNGRSAALVARDGSIDWLAWPRFDSPSLFAAILDPRAGAFQVGPAGPAATTRRYLPGTNVLETRFETRGGTAVLTDLMPIAGHEPHAAPPPEHEVLRIVECTGGEVELEVLFDPRPGWATTRHRVVDAGALGLRVETTGELYTLRAEPRLRLEPSPDGGLRARVRLAGGGRLTLSLVYAGEGPASLPPLGDGARRRLDETARSWREWSAHAPGYDGPAREAVERSALVLKLLAYAPSGAVVAAPTTSLPERLGGAMNWDYRFCWLRDAAWTVRALVGLGHEEEAAAFVSWLLHTTRLTRPELRILYDVYGRLPRDERELAHLAGYRGSRPVRAGNAAAEQLQLDVYGEVVDATAYLVRRGGYHLDRETAGLLRELGDWVCRHWRVPDEGIWEPRSGRQLHTHSRVLCWVALDRLLELAARGHLRAAPVDRWWRAREQIRDEIEATSWSPSLHSFVDVAGGDDVDSCLLQLSFYGFEQPASARMRGTFRLLRARLGADRALLYRNAAFRRAGEGAFGICSFWAVDHLARGGGSLEEALEGFEDLLGHANDVGLYGEEIDPASGAQLGNFPQAFTHVGLINAALTLRDRHVHLEERRRRERPVQPEAEVHA